DDGARCHGVLECGGRAKRRHRFGIDARRRRAVCHPLTRGPSKSGVTAKALWTLVFALPPHSKEPCAPPRIGHPRFIAPPVSHLPIPTPDPYVARVPARA